MGLPDKYIAIDEEGYPLLKETRVTDINAGSEILRNIKFAQNGSLMTTWGGVEAIVEAFDEAYVAAQVLKVSAGWRLLLPYGLEIPFDPHTLTLDDWDRFHGTALNGIPFVFSRKAQGEFFNLVDEFSDDTVTINGEEITLKPWLEPRPDVHTEKFWSHIYQTETPRWELNEATPALKDLLPRLKLPKSRVLVLGCGSGNDAAFFAEHGHVVTAVDISPEAISRGKAKYGHLSNLTWIEQDLFKLGQEHNHSYDLVFEHTCYCAIDPSLRNKMVQAWKKFLAPGGFLMGVFFVMERRSNPPFGGTEWELRQRLKDSFHFVFWGRWHQSIDRRNGKELLVYAQKKSS